MSTYFSQFTCRACRHLVIVGFIGDTSYTVAFCAACAQSFRVAAAPGERLLSSAAPHQLLVFGKQRIEVPFRSGRRTRTVTHMTWIASGVTVPVDEDLVQHGDDIRISYTLNYSSIACPACGVVGRLVDFRAYVQRCPRCGGDCMDEHEL